jgi:hypothetical protein
MTCKAALNDRQGSFVTARSPLILESISPVYEGYGYPISWPSTHLVDDARILLMKNLGYTELLWNIPRMAKVESQDHFELRWSWDWTTGGGITG